MSFAAWVSDLETVVDAAGLQRFPLLGISQGAAIATAYAVRHPERVSHLILYGGFARGQFHRDANAEQEVRVLSEAIRIGWGKEHAAFRQLFTSLYLPEGSPDQFHAFNELQRISSSPENAVRIVEGVSDIDVSDLATRVDRPALVLHASGDLRIPFAEGRHLAALIPTARFVPLKSNNHILLAHEPAWSQFLEEIDRFLPTVSA